MSRHHAKLHRRRWAAVRRSVLDRDGWRCRRCGAAARLEVHHVEPLSAGGDPYDPAGLVAMCRPCHFRQHRRRRRVTPWDRLIAELTD